MDFVLLNYSLQSPFGTGVAIHVFHKRKWRLRGKDQATQTAKQRVRWPFLPPLWCMPSELLLTSETVVDFTECCKTTPTSVHLPAGRFPVTPPLFLQANTVYERGKYSSSECYAQNGG